MRAITRTDWQAGYESAGETVFTVNDALRALPYVARVIEDAVSAFHATRDCRARLAQSVCEREKLQLSERRDFQIKRLDRAIDECDAVGANLHDIDRGVVSFLANIGSRRVNLVWCLGEAYPQNVEEWTEASIAGDLRGQSRRPGKQ